MWFQNNYVPHQNIAIDESLTLWKGRLSFRIYLPLKSCKFCVKTFEICESSTEYLWKFVVYTGRDTDVQTTIDYDEINFIHCGEIIGRFIQP